MELLAQHSKSNGLKSLKCICFVAHKIPSKVVFGLNEMPQKGTELVNGPVDGIMHEFL